MTAVHHGDAGSWPWPALLPGDSGHGVPSTATQSSARLGPAERLSATLKSSVWNRRQQGLRQAEENQKLAVRTRAGGGWRLITSLLYALLNSGWHALNATPSTISMTTDSFQHNARRDRSDG